MAIRDNREYRSFPMVEIREEGDEPTYRVEGYASTFDTYTLFEYDGVEYKEKIDPEAFEDCDMSDVIFLRDHVGTVYARTKNKTLELSIDEKGLFTRTDLSKTAAAREMFEEIQTGMYSQMSFAFTVDAEEYDERTHTRTIKHIKKLYDVSAVSFPANPYTDIDASTRSKFDGFIEQERAERLKRAAELEKARAHFNFVKES